jgi:hypothetical protein
MSGAADVPWSLLAPADVPVALLFFFGLVSFPLLGGFIVVAVLVVVVTAGASLSVLPLLESVSSSTCCSGIVFLVLLC